ncbi:MAG: metal ABC transporter ATP-binding protein [Chitinophagales bacterium]
METNTNRIIEVHDLTVSYNKKPALWNVDFDLPEGKIIGIIGPNGAGKSTLLKSIMGLLPMASGYIKIYGKDLEAIRKRVSYVPQRGSVDWDFPASVREVVMMGLYQQQKWFRGASQLDQQKVDQALEKVGMLPFAHRHISQLSGGQQQRVFLARAMAQQADLYLMDEPFAGVDASTESSILELLSTMRNEGKTIIVVHHDLQTAKDYFDHIVLLNTRLIAAGPVEEVFTPQHLQDAYGGKLTLLHEVGELLQKENIPTREG